MTVDHSPARRSSVFTVGAVALVVSILVVSAAAVTVVPVLMGLVGGALIGLGLRRRSGLMATVGSVGLFGGVLLAGLFGARPVTALAGTALTVLAWDAGTNAIEVGERMGHAAQTQRVETVHIAATMVVVALAAGAGYFTYLLSAGGQSPIALVALLLATVLLTASIRGSLGSR